MKKEKNILDAKNKMLAAIAIVCMAAIVYSASAYAAEVTGSNMSAKIYQNMSEGSVVGNLLVGNQFEILSADVDENGAVWYKVKTDFGIEGYVTESEMNGLVQAAATMGQQAATQNQPAGQEQTEAAQPETQTQIEAEENNADNTTDDNSTIVNAGQNNNTGIPGAGVTQAMDNINEITAKENLENMEEQIPESEEQESSELQTTDENAKEDNTQEEIKQSASAENNNPESGSAIEEDIQSEEEQKEENGSQESVRQSSSVNVHSGILLPVLLVIGIAVCIAGIIYFTGKIKKLR